MFLFKRKQKEPEALVANRAMQRIADKWFRYKKRIALFLQRKSESLSDRGKKLSLFLFCLLFGGGSIAITFEALRKDSAKAVPVRIAKTPMPKAGRQEVGRDSLITKKEFENIQGYKAYILGLHNTKEGQRIYDSLISARPKLFDSIQAFEKIYLSQ